MSLRLDAILCAVYVSIKMATTDPDKVVIRTAPYLETCRTKRDASLNSGRGTMVTAGEVLSAGAGAVCEVPVQCDASALFCSLPIGVLVLHSQNREVQASHGGLKPVGLDGLRL